MFRQLALASSSAVFGMLCIDLTFDLPILFLLNYPLIYSSQLIQLFPLFFSVTPQQSMNLLSDYVVKAYIYYSSLHSSIIPFVFIIVPVLMFVQFLAIAHRILRMGQFSSINTFFIIVLFLCSSLAASLYLFPEQIKLSQLSLTVLPFELTQHPEEFNNILDSLVLISLVHVALFVMSVMIMAIMCSETTPSRAIVYSKRVKKD